MAAINLGAVSVAIDASGSKFYFFKSGVITDCGTNINHAVTAIGYGYDKKTNMNYYLVKNSWGSSWGDKGYVKLWNKGDGEGTCAI
jgi:KDEL-tailed cysteine endopeptidase